MIEVITKDKDGRERCREIENGATVKLYGDEIEVTVYIAKPVRRKKAKK